jgi:hypothetical protein
MTQSTNWPMYRGTKDLKAIPMTKAEYCLLRGWEVPAGENPAECGYTVEYQDGGAPNIAGFDGYVSWSPGDVFERTYHRIETHVDRMRFEQSDLYDKMQKLSAFIHGDSVAYADLSRADQRLMQAQLDAMKSYHTILTSRIASATE